MEDFKNKYLEVTHRLCVNESNLLQERLLMASKNRLKNNLENVVIDLTEDFNYDLNDKDINFLNENNKNVYTKFLNNKLDKNLIKKEDIKKINKI